MDIRPKLFNKGTNVAEEVSVNNKSYYAVLIIPQLQ